MVAGKHNCSNGEECKGRNKKTGKVETVLFKGWACGTCRSEQGKKLRKQGKGNTDAQPWTDSPWV